MNYFLENQIEELIKNTVLAEDPEQEIWRTPHFATASISDREFGKLRTWVHEDHLMPGDLLPGGGRFQLWKYAG